MITSIAQQIKSRMGHHHPKTAIILGSGLGSLAEKIDNAISINYADIEGFPQSTVSGHGSRLIIGNLNGVEVLCLQGRFHLYEGHKPQVIKTVICALKELGIKRLIVTNAAGSLNPEIAPGQIMLISDHINFSGQTPLIGAEDEKYGPRFPDVSDAYNANLRHKIQTIAEDLHIPLAQGVYLMVLGPNFETAAEIRAFRILGADAVGMSTVPEVICAAYAGIEVLGLSVITNFGTGMKKGAQSHEETLAQGQKASANLQKLITTFLVKMEQNNG